MGTTGNDDNRTIPGRWSRAKQIEDECSNNDDNSQPSPLLTKKSEDSRLAQRTQSNESETDSEVAPESEGLENGLRQTLLYKQFSWEVAESDVAAVDFATKQGGSDQDRELYLTSPPSPPPLPSARHVFHVPLQELCER
jgi:hypothetical protein